MSNYIFHLDTSSKKYKCPGCDDKSFTYYVFSDTKKIFNELSGRCDHDNSCKYHRPPKDFFSDTSSYQKGFLFPRVGIKGNGNQETSKVLYLPNELLIRSTDVHKACDLYPFLRKLFRDEIASYLCRQYYVGSNKEGRTAFFRVDIDNNVCQVKIIKYNSESGKRNKDVKPFFAGRIILGLSPDDTTGKLRQCFFGEHLLSRAENIDKQVALVESEKTALIASVYFPQCVWLATGGKTGCKWTDPEVCKVLKGRIVILFPDLGAFDDWKQRGKRLATAARCEVRVSNTLERNATQDERKRGLDIADYLLRDVDSTGLALTGDNYPIMIDYYPLIASKLNNQNSNIKYDGNEIKTISNEVPPLGPPDRGEEIQQAISETTTEAGPE